MKRIALFLFSLSYLFTVVLTGCGGGSKSLTGLKTTGNKIAGRGKAVVQLTWPKRGKSTSRLIPQAANSVKVVILNNGTPVVSTVLPRPAISDPSTSTYDFTDLVPGVYSAQATAYPSADATTGVAQASVTVPLTITTGQSTPLTLTMNSTVNNIQVTSAGNATALTPGSTLQLTATPRDATGAIVLTTAANLTWDTSNHSKATIAPNGLVTGVAVGSVLVTALDTEHNKTGTFNLDVNALPPPANFLMVTGTVGTYDIKELTPSRNVVSTTPLNISSVPGALAHDAYGILYLDLPTENRIVALTLSSGQYSTGTALTSVAGLNLNNPQDFVYDYASSKYYLADTGNNRVVQMDDIAGTNAVVFPNGATPGGQTLSSPTRVHIGADHKIYIADSGNHRVVALDNINGTGWTSYSSGLSQSQGIDTIGITTNGTIWAIQGGEFFKKPSASGSFTSLGTAYVSRYLARGSDGYLLLTFNTTNGALYVLNDSTIPAVTFLNTQVYGITR